MKARSSLVQKLSKSLHPSLHQPGITAQGRPGDRMSIGRVPIPTNPRTEAQEAHRLLYSKCSVLWGQKTEEDKDLFSDEAKVKYLTNYNVFMGHCLLQQLYQLFEYYLVSENSNRAFYGIAWRGNRLICGQGGTDLDHLLTRVKLKLYRVGLPGKLVVSIRECDYDSKPLGSDICTGEIDGNELTTDTAGEWYEIDIGGALVEQNGYVAIIYRCTDGDSSNKIHLKCEVSPYGSIPCYSWISIDSGSSWIDESRVRYPYYGYGLLGEY